MWTTLALVAALGPTLGQADQLKLTNIRATYGILGAERQDNKLLPGDIYFLAFDIEGIKPDETGKVLYSMGMEVTNSQGKVQFGSEPQKHEAINSLGGNRLQGSAFVRIGLDHPPGTFTVKVTVTDQSVKPMQTQTLERKFEVLKKDFGLVTVRTSYDPEGRFAAPPGGVVGQTIWVNFAVVGFGRDKNKKPDIDVALRILDEAGKPTIAKPAPVVAKETLEEGVVAIPIALVISLNRPGKFTVELDATDQTTNKKSQVSFPLTVVEQRAAAEQR